VDVYLVNLNYQHIGLRDVHNTTRAGYILHVVHSVGIRAGEEDFWVELVTPYHVLNVSITAALLTRGED